MTALRLAWPLRLADDGRLATVEQDSPEDVQQCVAAILRHRIGDRFDAPGLGVPDPTFAEHVDIAGMVPVVSRHEPRAPVTAGSTESAIERALVEIGVTVHTTEGDQRV
ncbi:MAG: hypothetical protein PGN13_16040 [Patulibacter minatonensis]